MFFAGALRGGAAPPTPPCSVVAPPQVKGALQDLSEVVADAAYQTLILTEEMKRSQKVRAGGPRWRARAAGCAAHARPDMQTLAPAAPAVSGCLVHLYFRGRQRATSARRRQRLGVQTR